MIANLAAPLTPLCGTLVCRAAPRLGITVLRQALVVFKTTKQSDISYSLLQRIQKFMRLKNPLEYAVVTTIRRPRNENKKALCIVLKMRERELYF